MKIHMTLKSCGNPDYGQNPNAVHKDRVFNKGMILINIQLFDRDFFIIELP